MPYNSLGYYTQANLRSWTESAIECYKNKLMCKFCTIPDDLKCRCKMKPYVLELFKKFGKPEIRKEYNMQLTQTDIDEMRRCAKRELNKRINFYPKWIAAGRMTQEKADFEIAGMKKICDYFDYMQIHAKPEQQTLF